MRVFKISRTSKKLLTKEVLAQIEERGEVKVIVRFDEIEINAKDEDNGGAEWIAEQVVKAIVYGFEPKHAYKLFNDEYFFETIDLSGAFRRKEKGITRGKSRIIGEGGKARKKLEELSETNIMVSNATDNVSIIGKFQNSQNVKEAIMRLLEGSPHESVYRFLESKNKEY